MCFICTQRDKVTHLVCVHYATNFSIRNVFHIITKCIYLKKMIPKPATCVQ